MCVCVWVCVCVGVLGSVLDIKAIIELLFIPGVLQLVLLKTLVGIPAGVYHSMFTMVNMERFQLTPEINGRLLSFIGILTIVRNGDSCQVMFTDVVYTHTHTHTHR